MNENMSMWVVEFFCIWTKPKYLIPEAKLCLWTGRAIQVFYGDGEGGRDMVGSTQILAFGSLSAMTQILKLFIIFTDAMVQYTNVSR